MMLSHNAFLIAYDVYTGKLTELSTTKLCGLSEVVDSGFVKIEKRGTKISVFGTEKLCKLLEAGKLPPPQKLLFKNSVAQSEALRSSEASTETAKSSEFEAVGPLIARSVKHSNPAYRAVVDGKQPRRNPITEYARKLSPIDAADFWQAYGELSDDEQTAYSRSLASASRRGQ